MNKFIIPYEIRQALDNNASIVSSISGGKDSQTQQLTLTEVYHHLNLNNKFITVHSHLGQAAWPQSLPFCQQLSQQTINRPLIVVKRPQGDLLTQIRARMNKLKGTGKPFWPSPTNRYCTSDQKRAQIDKILRKQNDIVISVQGFRAEESTARRKKQPVELNRRLTSAYLKNYTIIEALKHQKPGQRVAINWYPLLAYTEADVYARCGHSLKDRNHRRDLYQAGKKTQALAGWKMHPAYVFGNNRVSCILCFMAINDLTVGATHHPILLTEYIDLETEGGATFKHGWSLKELL